MWLLARSQMVKYNTYLEFFCEQCYREFKKKENHIDIMVRLAYDLAKYSNIRYFKKLISCSILLNKKLTNDHKFH
jgi:hypothetical protein